MSYIEKEFHNSDCEFPIPIISYIISMLFLSGYYQLWHSRFMIPLDWWPSREDVFNYLRMFQYLIDYFTTPQFIFSIRRNA